MPDNGGEAPYFVLRRSSLVLEIGWTSLNPVNVVTGQTVLLINAKIKKYERRTTNDEQRIHFSLNEDPISELADGEGNVLYDARLSVADAGFKVQGSRFKVEAASVVVYPNPAKDLLNVEFVMENNGPADLQLVTMQGITVSIMTLADAKPGLNKAMLDVSHLPNGAYILRVTGEGILETVMVIVNR